MKQEAGWGAAAVIAIAAAVGISSRSTPAPQEGARPGGRPQAIATKSKTQKPIHRECSDLVELFQAFLLDDNVAGPTSCYETGYKSDKNTANKSKDNTDSQPKFIIATLPDPLHTHFSLLFDRLVEAIQDGAQDEGYEYDSSWLPWDTEEPSLALLADKDEADDRKKNREEQPGVLLFRSPTRKGQTARQRYQEGLFVFIIGEDPTDGIHRKQFENTMDWIDALQTASKKLGPVAILGPTFSGSFPSLAELLANDKVHRDFSGLGKQLAIYSGSASSNGAVEWFRNSGELKDIGITFHSFLQDDDTSLGRFCKYLEGRDLEDMKDGKKKDDPPPFDLHRVAILSEDETAYGYGDPEKELCPGAPWLYYPRDISTLRAAYQKQSIFNTVSPQPTQSTAQRNNLPTDLADPAGEEHDTVRTYAGNQTPLSQEAQLLGIVSALRSHRAQYVVLRSSNTLDPLFLANFLRREYPEARVVILNSDLLFQRGQDALALTGVMTLSTYPLLPWEREWTAARPPSSIHSHRVFPENSTEGTYIASRLLLHSQTFDQGPVPPACNLSADELQPGTAKEIFVPSILCNAGASYVPIPDYAPPVWAASKPCADNNPGDSCKPATWLSVITKTGSWPLAALNDYTLKLPVPPYTWRTLLASPLSGPIDHPDWAPLPLAMKLFMVLLLGLALFHAWCCLFASFTAKPAFRAHFATPGWRHRALILLGSFVIALLALLAGWGCGIFSSTPKAPFNTGWVRSAVFVVWIIAGFSIGTNIVVTRELNEDATNRHRGNRSDARFRWTIVWFMVAFLFLIAVALYGSVYQLERALTLANRIFVYWRSMNLTSGISPIVPFLSLTMGLYIWFRYSLHGLALFGPDRPRLPSRVDLVIKLKDAKDPARHEELNVLNMFSQECVARPAEQIAKPLAWKTLLLSLILFVVFWAIAAYVLGEVPVRSLGATKYAIIFCLSLGFCFSLILGAAWQLWMTWSQLRQLLVFLDRLPLRRTMEALRGFSWGTVWKMSGNVLDVRYKLLSRQLEALNHLHTSLQGIKDSAPDSDADELKRVKNCLTAVATSRDAGMNFAKWYAVNYCNPKAAGLRAFEEFQKQIAASTGLLLSELLIPAWRKEKHSLTLVEPDASDAGKNKQSSPESKEEYIRNAEEVTCLTYLGFVQNILGRIRTMALAGLFLFVATTLAVSNYPFDPRPALSAVLLVLFLGFGAVIVFVYADMHRDATLSHITNTNPGELGSEFWIKIIGFGAAPLLGLITTVFPEMSGFLFSWLQPGIASLK